MMKFKSFALLLLMFATYTFAQTKNEKESRITLEQFPSQAQQVINTIIYKVKRIKHYKEIDGKIESFESKFKYKNHWHSVEFNKEGLLEDIEVTIKERHMSTTAKQQINNYLNTNFAKHDIIKVQEQYVLETSERAEIFVPYILEQRHARTSNYEIIVAVKLNSNWQIKEITFTAEGKFLSEREIKQDSYEYIMY